MTIKFNKFNVTNGTTKARVHYSVDNRADGRSCVTIYAKDYDDALGVVFGDTYVNDTDYHTDYFDKGRVVLFEDHALYQAARARAVEMDPFHRERTERTQIQATIRQMLGDWNAATPEQREEALRLAKGERA